MARTRRRHAYRKSKRWNPSRSRRLPKHARWKLHRRDKSRRASSRHGRATAWGLTTSARARRRRNPKYRNRSYGLIPRESFRKAVIWNMARRGKRVYKHLPGTRANPRRGRGRHGGRRRNPSGTVLRDGTSVRVDGDSVTLISPYGETYDYEGVERKDIARLHRAGSFKHAAKIVGSHSMLRSINPRGRRGRSKARHRSRRGRR